MSWGAPRGVQLGIKKLSAPTVVFSHAVICALGYHANQRKKRL